MPVHILKSMGTVCFQPWVKCGPFWIRIASQLYQLRKKLKGPSILMLQRIITRWCQKVSSGHAASAAAKSLQLCLTLCNPIDYSPPGSPVPGILQARTLECVAFSFSSAWKWKVNVKSLSRVQLLATPWTAAHQASLSMGLAWQEYWSGLPLPSPSSGHEDSLMDRCPMTIFFWPPPHNVSHTEICQR